MIPKPRTIDFKAFPEIEVELAKVRFKYSHKKNTLTGCWEWTGKLTGTRCGCGYGRIGFNKTNFLAHRFSYALHNNGYLGDLFVCHKCDNPKCVNPEHLFAGTNIDNINDKINKGRVPKGKDHHGTILNDETVLRMKRGAVILRKSRNSRSWGRSHYAHKCSERFGISFSTACSIASNDCRKYIQI